MHRLSLPAVLVGAAALAPCLAHAQTEVEQPKLPNLLVMDLVIEGEGISDAVARLLNELLLSEFQEPGRYQVTGGSDIQAMVSGEVQKQLAGCSDVACLTEMAGALDTDLLGMANLGRVGGEYLLNVKVIDVRKGVAVGRETVRVKTEPELTDALRRVVKKVIAEHFGEVEATPTGEPAPAVAVEPGPPEASTPVVPWIALGASVAVGAVGGILLGTMGDETSIRDEQYAAYLAASGSARDAAYDDVRSAVERHNATFVAGIVLASAGAVAAVTSLVVALVGGADDAPEPIVAPNGDGAVFGLGGTF